MGYFLLYESMFDSVLYARNKWLREGGILMPNRAQMFAAALDDEVYYNKKLVSLNLSRTIGITSMELA
jgi:protein arginine N-methyltransferase 1